MFGYNYYKFSADRGCYNLSGFANFLITIVRLVGSNRTRVIKVMGGEGAPVEIIIDDR